MFSRIMTEGLAFYLSATLAQLSWAQLPAFPGAQGFGSTTPGGRGGVVYEVTNLNDSGSGSLRAACQASGARIVVFRVGGTIDLQSAITIDNPFITIAGQTAPGGGICLKGNELVVKTHDVIIRGLRIRVGGNGGLDGLRLSGNDGQIRDIIVDHCSVSWAGDENLSTFLDVTDATFSWNIISEALNPTAQSFGLLLGKNGAANISVHHNLFIHNRARQPKVANANSAEVINNVIYDYENKGTAVAGGGARANIIGNQYIPGPGTFANKKGINLEVNTGTATVYVKDNLGPGRETNSGDDWLVVAGSEQYRSMTPALTPSGISADPVEHLFQLLLDNAGAIAPQRDPVDNRVVQDVRDGTGHLIDSEIDVGGWPQLDAGTPAPDTDHDGMPNDWEIAFGLDPNDPADQNQDRDSDGYTNVEEYINGFLPPFTDWQPPDDFSPPQVSILRPTEETNYVSNQLFVDLSGTASDDQGVILLRLTNDRDNMLTEIEGRTNWSFDRIELSEGLNTLTVTALDEAGNTGADFIKITYIIPDSIAPMPPRHVTVESIF